MLKLQNPVRLAIGVMLTLTLYRLALHGFNSTDLFVDEAQYWLWGQHLDFGYYSKPPMIGWLLRGVTELAGSDATFWIRAPAPVLHLIAGLLLMGAANRYYGSQVAAWVGPIYLSLPIVTVGSALMSTDTVLLPFWALALWMVARLREKTSLRDAVILGVALGLGMLSKYAAIYFVLGLGFATLFVTETRLSRRDLIVALVVMLLVFWPNIWWNITHDATTLRHTAHNADWKGELHPLRMLEFILSQFAAFGPILFAALLAVFWNSIRAPRQPAKLTLVFLSAPILAIVIWQALMSKAYANWAATAFAAGTILVCHMLSRGNARWLRWSLILHLVPALLLPLALCLPQALALPDGRLALERYLGRAEFSRNVAATLESENLSVVVARDRSLLADLFYTLRDTDFEIHALTRPGFADSYYEQKFPIPTDLQKSVLYVGNLHEPICVEARLIREIHPDNGAYRGRSFGLYELTPDCLADWGS